MRKARLEGLLEHAVTTVPYFQSYRETRDLQRFPVINKKRIQDHFADFRSKEHLDDKLHKVSTSGSTGMPFTLYHDGQKRSRNLSDVLYFSNASGYTIGNRLIELEVWRSHNTRNNLKNLLQNTVQFDISKLTKERIEQLLALLGDSSDPKNLLGFASALESICTYLDAEGIEPRAKNLRGIIANSEYLNAYTRESARKHFKCPVYSRYSSEEVGILAQQTPLSGDDFQINWASYHIELLDMHEDIPAKEGTLGRLVVTDLFNRSMPLIRYDTGDVAMFRESDPRFLRAVEGRKMDMVFDTQGNMLSSFVVYTKFHPYYSLLNQYQFFQMGAKQYHVKLNLKAEKFEFEQELMDSIRKDFGQDATVTLELVNEIPPLASGKRKKVVNLYGQP